MVNQKTRELLYDGLSPKGAEFRKGLRSGRMANFLDNNPDRIGMAFFNIDVASRYTYYLLWGWKSVFKIILQMPKKSAKLRELRQKKNSKNKVDMLSYFDSRDINRGPIQKSTFYRQLNNQILLTEKFIQE